MTKIEGKCACGAVKLEITGAPKVAFYCHCDDCQRVHSATAVPVMLFAAGDVKVTGEVRTWALKVTPRTSCAVCGTRLFAEPPGMGVRGVVASALPDGVFTPAFHIQCRLARSKVADSLPHFAGFPAAFGGSDATVDW